MNEPSKSCNIATMKAAELEAFIKATEAEHREYMKSLRALMRIRFLEERAKAAE